MGRTFAEVGLAFGWLRRPCAPPWPGWRDLISGKPKPQDVEGVGRMVREAVRRADAPRAVEPGAPPDHPEGARIGPYGIDYDRIFLGVTPPPIAAPLPDIAEHVIQAPC